MVFTRENSGVPCFETTPFFLEADSGFLAVQGAWKDRQLLLSSKTHLIYLATWQSCITICSYLCIFWESDWNQAKQRAKDFDHSATYGGWKKSCTSL